MSYKEVLSVKLGLPPKPSNPNVTKSMKGNKATDTKPELILRKVLWAQGYRGYRLHWKEAPGHPDICFIKKRFVIFVNGCFWHRCPYCKLPLPKSNRAFWSKKFQRNKERDRLKILRLRSLGWKTMTIWECKIKNHLDKTIKTIIKTLTTLKTNH